MLVLSHNTKSNLFVRLVFRSFVIVLIFSLTFYPSINYAQQISIVNLPQPGTLVNLSAAYVPVLIKGLRVHKDNPLAMDFIVDTGNTGLKLGHAGDKQILSDESKRLIKYFLAALTLPEKEIWVNLSPYEKDRIVPKGLGQTEMGRDMLAQDYILKQITASLIYPERGIGKEFWQNIYNEAYKKFGTTQVPVNTFNKVWIMADRATVYENKDTAFVVDSHLKVMLEEDYLSLQKHLAVQGDATDVGVLSAASQDTHSIGSKIIRQIILPALEKEINEGKNFANLRQIFHSLILAKWYKQALKTALINQVYSNKNKVGGLSYKNIVSSVGDPQHIYQQYLKAYKRGVFNFIKEDIDQATQQPLPRKYFSGGVVGEFDEEITRDPHRAMIAAEPTGTLVMVEAMQTDLDRSGAHPAYLGVSVLEAKSSRLFDGTAEGGIIRSPLSSVITFKVKADALQSIEKKLSFIDMKAAGRLFGKLESLSDAEIDVAFKAYMDLILREFLSTNPDVKSDRINEIGAYLQGRGFNIEINDDLTLLDTNDVSKATQVDVYLLENYENLKSNDEAMNSPLRAFAPTSISPAGKKTYSPDNVRHLKLDEEKRRALDEAKDVTLKFHEQFVKAREYLGEVSNKMLPGDPDKIKLSRVVVETDRIKIKLVKSQDVLKYGYALDKAYSLDKSNPLDTKTYKTIYLDETGWEKAIFEQKMDIEGRSDDTYFEFLTREIIRMAAAGELGYKYAYLYAFNRHTEQVRPKFPDGSEPTEIIKANRKALLLPLDEFGKSIPQTEDALLKIAESVIPDGQERGLKIIVPKENAYKIMEESNALMENNYYEIGTYFLNGIVKGSDNFKSFLNGIKGSLDMMNTFFVFFATKANPITLAHLNVTIASVMKEAVRYFSQGDLLSMIDSIQVSPEDMLRKPDVGKTAVPRQYFARHVIGEIFGSIVEIMPNDRELGEFIDYLKKRPELAEFVAQERTENGVKVSVFDRLNGEENLHRLIRVFKMIGMKMFGYPVGGDHLRVFAKRTKGDEFIKSDFVDSDHTRYLVSYYPEINPRFWADLVIGQHESGGARIFDENSKTEEQVSLRKLYEELLNVKGVNADDENNQIKDIVRNAKYLPQLDTCGKLAIINSEYGNNIDLVLFHTVRGKEDVTDVFRDKLTSGFEFDGRSIKGVPIVDVKGIESEMNATGIREALIKVVRDRTFDFNGFSSANRTLLEFLFLPENHLMLNVILRQKDKNENELILPKTIRRTWFPNEVRGQMEYQEHLEKLEERLVGVWGSDFPIKVEEGPEIKLSVKQKLKGSSDVDVDFPVTNLVLKVGEEVKGSLLYYVVNGFDKFGNQKNTINFDFRPAKGVPYDIFLKESIEILKDAETTYNQANRASIVTLAKPKAFVKPDAKVEGGIDFNTSQMKMRLQKEGAGVAINFNPAMLKRFESADFQGFTPIIINILPITNIASILGLRQEEAGVETA